MSTHMTPTVPGLACGMPSGLGRGCLATDHIQLAGEGHRQLDLRSSFHLGLSRDRSCEVMPRTLRTGTEGVQANPVCLEAD